MARDIPVSLIQPFGSHILINESLLLVITMSEVNLRWYQLISVVLKKDHEFPVSFIIEVILVL